jgi:hypothetical protein
MDSKTLVTVSGDDSSISISSTLPKDMNMMVRVLKALDEFEKSVLKEMNLMARDTISNIPISITEKEVLLAMNDAIAVSALFENLVKSKENLDKTAFQKIKDIRRILEGC